MTLFAPKRTRLITRPVTLSTTTGYPRSEAHLFLLTATTICAIAQISVLLSDHWRGG